jgi:hypothetical protein
MIKTSVLRKLLSVGLFGVAALGICGTAEAAAGYCVASPLTGDPLALTDVTFTIGATVYGPDDCYGIVDTHSSDIANNLAYLNTLSWQNFTGGVKDDAGGGSNQAIVNSIKYTLTTGTLSNGGTLNSTQAWTLAWEDTNGATPPNLPLLVDFALLWNGGNSDVFYLFEDVLLPITPNSGSGLIDIKVTNSPGPNGPNSDIGTSHLDVFLTNGSPLALQRRPTPKCSRARYAEFARGRHSRRILHAPSAAGAGLIRKSVPNDKAPVHRGFAFLRPAQNAAPRNGVRPRNHACALSPTLASQAQRGGACTRRNGKRSRTTPLCARPERVLNRAALACRQCGIDRACTTTSEVTRICARLRH